MRPGGSSKGKPVDTPRRDRHNPGDSVAATGGGSDARIERMSRPAAGSEAVRCRGACRFLSNSRARPTTLRSPSHRLAHVDRPAGRPAGAARAAACIGAFLLIACGACVSELQTDQTVVLPVGVDRFIDEPTEISADEVLIEAVRQFRAEVAPVVDRDYHSKTVTPDRIHLVNLDPSVAFQPVSLTFRNMHVTARRQIDVRFSDKSLLEKGAEADVLLLIANGVASLEGPGYDLTAPRIVIRNDQVRAYGEQGEAWPLPPYLR